MGRKRTLADDLADLATTAPSTEVDVDRQELGQAATLERSDEEEEDRPISKKAKKAAERALRLRADINLESEEYGGRTTTRKAVFGDNDSSPAVSDSQEGGESEEQSDSEGEAGLPSPNGSSLRRSGSEGSAEEQDTAAAAGIQTDPRDVTGDEEVYADTETVDETATAHLKSRLAKDKAKAKATRAQQAVWERLLEIRILLQKGLTASHQLPDCSAAPALTRTGPLAKGSLELQEELRETMAELLNLHNAMVSQNPALAAEAPDATGALAQAEGTELWDQLEERYKQLGSFRDSSLDRWYRRALLSSGHLALKGNLQLLNQSVSGQVASMMRNSERLIRKAQLPTAGAPRPLFSAPTTTTLFESKDGRDPERYDDSDFYQQLLKEFLEANSATLAVGAVSGLRGKKTQSLRDRRASKGRRLRYDVQEKLVNFMVPRKYEEPPMASQLFRNLFGTRT